MMSKYVILKVSVNAGLKNVMSFHAIWKECRLNKKTNIFSR